MDFEYMVVSTLNGKQPEDIKKYQLIISKDDVHLMQKNDFMAKFEVVNSQKYENMFE